MGTSEAVLQVLSGATSLIFNSTMGSSNLESSFPSKFLYKCSKKRASGYKQLFKCSSMLHSDPALNRLKGLGYGLSGYREVNRLQLLSCKCQQAESVSGLTAEDGNGSWFVDSAKKLNLNGVANTPNILEFQDVQQFEQEKKGLTSNGAVGKTRDSVSKASVDSLEDEAWNLLRDSMVYYCRSPIGTIAANDPTSSNVLNYDQVFIRDFIPSGIAFLLKGEYEIVRNFILHTLQLQSWEKTMDCHSPGQGLMPASFKVRTVPLDGDDSATEEVLDPDFGEAAIGRVAPVDSGLWWIILLRAYGKCSGDLSVQERIDVQTGIKMILRLCLADGFDMFPTLLVTDGSCMIDRRMGIHGHPLEIQALFYSALLCAREMLAREDGSADLIQALNNRLVALSFHIREYYWNDLRKLNEIYRYKTEEYSYDAVNKFNIYPDQIPPWLVEWMPNKGGYLIGNLQPAHMDFRFFSLGNIWSIVSSLATMDQSHAILDLIEAKWGDLVADMPLKICYPALEGQEWQIITGSDPKNTPWSYHNAGSWPTLLWQFTVACIKMNRPEIAARAVQVAEKRLSRDKWPEYYDTKGARFIGKQAQLFQTWSIAVSDIPRIFPEGKFSPPLICTLHGCKSKTFTPIRSSARKIDFQKIRLQELLKSQDHEEGRVPRTVECELSEDLVDACIPGDVVTVTGIIRVINNYMDIGGGKSKSKSQGFYYLYLEAVSIKNSKSQSTIEELQDSNSNARATELADLFSFSARDLEFVVKFSEEYGSDIFRQIVQSICPSIYGHELVKAGITLALFGGVRKHSMDRNKVPVRGDIHVIVVGDPGLGKSQLLQAAAAISPRGIYVCGNATTKAGLTVAVVKDSMTSDYAFEAGAMVLADSGLCCIDEFDKMSAEHQALLEAMEQQCVSIAKAGLVASLSARTSVLAAANPVGGHYNRSKTVNENLKMSAALLSRFDLVFILLDKPDELLDKRVSEHIMSLHSGYQEHSPIAKKPRMASRNTAVLDLSVKSGSLVSKLRLDPKKDSDFVPLPAPLLRKYIAYARTFASPRMTKPAAEILQKFYLKLRDHNTSADGTPITARQLESLVRLAEARAKLDLREEITAQDALDVVEIMRESLYDKYVDEHGFVDFGRSGGMSRQKEAKRFLSALNKQSELQQKDCFSISEIYGLADRIGLRVPDIDTFVDNLNTAGFLLKKGPKTYQVLSSSYSRSQSSR